jgi:hypothetical protein
MVLPDGYGKGTITDERPQTANESLGGGHGGRVIIRFQAPPGATFDQTLHTFGTWATAEGYVRVQYSGGNVCTSSGVGATWGSTRNVVQLIYSGESGPHNSVSIPYGVIGLPHLGDGTVKTVAYLPTCS